MSRNTLLVSIPGSALHAIRCAFTDSPDKSFPVLVNGVKVGDIVHRLQYGSWSHSAYFQVLGSTIEMHKPLKECINSIRSIILNPEKDEVDDLQVDFSEYVKILTNYDGGNRDPKEVDGVFSKRRIESLAFYATNYPFRAMQERFSDMGVTSAEITFPKFSSDTNGIKSIWECMEEFKKRRRHAVDVITSHELSNEKISSNEELEKLLREKKIDFSSPVQQKINFSDSQDGERTIH